MSYPETAATTANDALMSKLSALRAGYFEDPLLRIIYGKPTLPRKDPMINRGTWFRVMYVERMVKAFVREHGEECAIISLGAGLDTLFWRLSETCGDIGFPPKHWIELDLPEITEQKAKKFLLSKGEPTNVLKKTNAGTSMDQVIVYRAPGKATDEEVDPRYKAHPEFRLIAVNVEHTEVWMRYVSDVLMGVTDSTRERDETKHAQLPTLFLSEVCLSYLESDATVHIIQTLPDFFENYGLVAFEMVNPTDTFGDMMIYNMSLREVYMPTFAEIGFVAQFQSLFAMNGYQGSIVREALSVYNEFLPSERKEMEAVEGLDELEPWNQIMNHYACIAAWRGTVHLDTIFNGLTNE